MSDRLSGMRRKVHALQALVRGAAQQETFLQLHHSSQGHRQGAAQGRSATSAVVEGLMTWAHLHPDLLQSLQQRILELISA